MKKKIICLVLCLACFLNVNAAEKEMYFLVNCEESRRIYKELTGMELTQSGGYWIDTDALKDLNYTIADDSSSDSKCGPRTSGKLACSFGCVEEAIDNVSSGQVVKAESIGELFDVLNEAGIFTSNNENPYCKVASSVQKKFSAPLDNSVIVKQGTRFNWLNSSEYILSLDYEQKYLVYFDYKLWQEEYNTAKSAFDKANEEYNKNKKIVDENKWFSDFPDSYLATATYDCPSGYFGSTTDKTKCIRNVSTGGILGDRFQTVNATVKYSCNKNSNLYNLKDKTCYFKYSKDNYKNALAVLDSLRETRNQAANKLSDLITKAKGCSNISISDYKPCDNVTISYDDEVYGEILKNDSEKYYQLDLKFGGSNISSTNSGGFTRYYSYYKCDGENCIVTGENVQFFSTKSITYSGTYDWDLKEDMFKCVGIDGYSFLRCELALKNSGINNYFGRYSNYITLERSNFPVNFNSKVGKHEISINYGCSDATSGEICHYNVTDCIGPKCDNTCDPTIEDCDNNNNNESGKNNGIDVIYRVINLNDPFPNRIPGENWNVQNYVEDYIKNNRNVVTDEVYTKEPMYEIELTPKLIKEIRNENKSVNYGDLNLYCKDGEECRSEFVRKLSDNGYLSGCGTSNSFDACKAGDV